MVVWDAFPTGRGKIVVRALVALTLLFAGCGGVGGGGGADGSLTGASGLTAQRAPRRIVAAMTSNPASMVARMNFAQISLPGVSNLEQLVNGSLAEIDGGGNVLPDFAMAIPSQDNGLWTLTPDGGMTTTWKVRRGVRWHDGTPLTAADFVFAFNVDRDPDVLSRRPIWYDYVTDADAPDPDTVTLHWNRVYVGADKAFASGVLSPLPRHLLQAIFESDKQAFLAMPYWTSGYVGTGPFRLTSFTLGSSLTLAANDDYAFGRPKIDEIEVRFIEDINTLVSNLMAGDVDLSMGRGFAVDQALLLRHQWTGGTIEWQPSAWVVAFPQFMNPGNPIVTNLAFRQALMYGTDRQALIDSLEGGLSTIAHFYMSPSEPEFSDVQSAAVQYEYDPHKAAQLLEGLGYTKGADGTYHDATGEPLAIQIRSNGEPITQTGIVPIASMWTQLGIATDPDVLSTQRLNDREYLATYPYFRLMRQGATAISLANFHTSAIPTAETHYVGINYARYSNPDLDGLIDKTLSEITYSQRIQDYRDAVGLMSQNLSMLGQFYDLSFVAKSARLTDVTASETAFWGIQKWGVTS